MNAHNFSGEGQIKRLSIVLAAILIVLQLCDSLSALPTTAYDAEMVVTGWLKADPQPLGMTLGRDVEMVETFNDNDGEPAYHIVYLHPSGIAIVSADDLVEPIIGFVNNGTYDPSPDSPLGALVTKDLNGRMAAVRSTFSPLSTFPSVAFTRMQQKWSYFIGFAEKQNGGFDLMGQQSICDDNLSDVRVAPLIKSQWDQELIYYDTQTSLGPSCYNYYTPQVLPGGELSWDKGDKYDGDPDNYSSGCIATAMAQLMLNYQWPVEAPIQPDFNDPNNTVGVGEKGTDGAFVPLVPRVYRNLLGGDEHGGKYKWDDMDFVPDQDTTLAQRKAIGAICHDAGVAAKMDYTADGSSTDLFKAKEALVNNFRYGNAVWGSSGADNLGSGLIGMILPNLDAKRPVILGISGESSGHSVVCDGYGYDVTETLYHHLNMGWSGTDDCWYNLPTIECSVSGYEYERGFECVYNVSKESKGEIISGRILNSDNEPADANVVCLEYEGLLIETAETDANGIFAFVDVNSNATYTIWVEGRDFSRREVTTGISRNTFSVSGNRWAVDFPSSRKTVYVDRQATAGTGDGWSWTNAFIDLQDALEAAANSPGKVSEIWVAAGTYRPDKGTKDRKSSFNLIDGVSLYGGFAGYETYREQMDPQINITTLSGDLNGNDGENFAGRSDNSYHVVNCSGTHGSTIIDGFTFTGGNANGANTDSIGGGMYIPDSSPSVRNCIFLGNSAQLGGGVYSNEGEPTLNNCTFTGNSADYGAGIFNETSSPILNNCDFISNEAKLAGNQVRSAGGGVYNNSSSPAFTDCRFTANTADNGAEIYNDSSNPTLSNCDFTSNEAKFAGGEQGSVAGALFNMYSDPVLTDCTFTENLADYGAGIYNDNSSPTLRNCNFNNNSAITNGGGMCSNTSNPILTGCIFSGNSADWGGGIFNYNSSPALRSCDFIENTAHTNSGGIHNQDQSNAEITDCTFNGNTANNSGGGMQNSNNRPVITDCIFSNNSAQYGGGISNNTSSPVLTNCSFIGNQAKVIDENFNSLGGGINNYMSDTVLLNCTLRDNSAQFGAGMFNSNNSSPILTNCNLVRNRASGLAGGIYNADNCRTELTNCIVWDNTVEQIYGNAGVSYSDVQGGWSGEGNNNINEDPLFADVDNGDYHLKSQAGRWDPDSQSWIGDNVTSPCIDSGDYGTAVGGELEPNGGRINMGAYGGTVEASKSP